jgi:hypothetical protein
VSRAVVAAIEVGHAQVLETLFQQPDLIIVKSMGQRGDLDFGHVDTVPHA